MRKDEIEEENGNDGLVKTQSQVELKHNMKVLAKY